MGASPGEQTAVEAVFREQGDRMWRTLRLATGNSDVASEAVAEAFAQLIARGSDIRDPAAWAWRSAFSIAAGEMKRRGRDRPLPEDLPARAPELLVDLERALRTLSHHQRVSILLADYAGWSHSEIARIIHSTPAAVAVHVHRARRRLKGILEVHDA